MKYFIYTRFKNIDVENFWRIQYESEKFSLKVNN